MPSRHILFVDPAAGPQPKKLAALNNADVIPRVVATISDAVRELEQAGFDALFVRVEGPKELSLVLRIRNASPEVPICALIPRPDEELGSLARESGADEVIPAERDSVEAQAAMSRALATTEALIRRARALVACSEDLRDRAQELRARSKALRLDVSGLRKVPVKDLVTLVVEDDPDQALFLSRSWKKLALPPPLPAIGNGEEAIAYLAGQGKYRDRARYPLPTLVVLDLHLPRKDGFEVLGWIRSQPELRKLVVFILTSSSLRPDLDRALELGADSFYVKPVSLRELDHIALSMAVRWGLLFQAHRKR